jgi:hypothetical protein
MCVFNIIHFVLGEPHGHHQPGSVDELSVPRIVTNEQEDRS